MARENRAGEAVEKTAGGDLLPLFLLSFRHRDEIAAMAARAERPLIAARRAEAIERRFINSGAAIAIVDARDARQDGLAACESLAKAVISTGSALLVILSEDDVPSLGAYLDAGITHYLTSPFGGREFEQMLRLADRFVERVAGGDKAASERASMRIAESEAWIWRPGSRRATLSRAFAERMGVERKNVPIAQLIMTVGRADRRIAYEAITRLISEGQATAFAYTSGSERIAHHMHYDEERGAVIGWIEASREDQESLYLPRDSLTALPPAEAIRAWVGDRLADMDTPHPRCVLMLVGVMRFGLINAAFGRVTGDALLQGIARRIERKIEQMGLARFMIARTTGSEFAIAFVPPNAADNAEIIAHRLLDTISRPFVSGETLIPLSCRIGIASADCDGKDDVASLFQRASAALSAAKHGDAGLVQALDVQGELETQERNRLEIDLRRALDQDQIDILFQPQVGITNGEIMGAEALARWRHPELGEVGAVPLFSAAARSNFVVQLSAHVQRRALEQAAAWPMALSRLRLSVNVTAADIARPTFVTDFLEMVDQTGFPRHRLTVEVTENGLIEDLASAADMLATLRRAGLRVAIDDFGTGYSSLAYLKALPLDYLKIDKTLAEDITGSTRDRIVVRGVIDMARSLGLSVITEGVETQAQLSLLAREGCNYYQGFLCSPPIDSVALAALVTGRCPKSGIEI
jgi:diguanylate cyclase (GGDEF)-like protein